MAKRPTITTLASGYLSNTAQNTNFTNIQEAFDNTLSRDGSAPNAMNADLDMNSNDINNVGTLNVETIILDGTDLSDLSNAAAEAASSAAAALVSEQNAALSAAAAQAVEDLLPDWKGAWATAVAYETGDLARYDGSTYICLVDHTSGTFSTDLSSNLWELFAQRGAAGSGTGDMLAANNLSDVSNPAAALANIGGQPLDNQLTDVSVITPSNGVFIVGNGTNFVGQSGSTARASLGLGSLATLNSISTAEIDASTLVVESEGISANDNDTTIPTSAAVRAYVVSAQPTVFRWDWSTNVNSVEFTNLSGFELIEIDIDITTNASQAIALQVSNNNGNTWLSSGYVGGAQDGVGGDNITNGFPVQRSVTGSAAFGSGRIFHLNNSTRRTVWSGTFGGATSTRVNVVASFYNTIEAHNAIRLTTSANITSGHIRLRCFA